MWGSKIDENLPMVAETRFELATFGLWAQRATTAPLCDIKLVEGLRIELRFCDYQSQILTFIWPLYIYGDPDGTWTRKYDGESVVTLASLSTGPFGNKFLISYYIYIIAYFFGFVHNFSCYNQKYFLIGVVYKSRTCWHRVTADYPSRRVQTTILVGNERIALTRAIWHQFYRLTRLL